MRADLRQSPHFDSIQTGSHFLRHLKHFLFVRVWSIQENIESLFLKWGRIGVVRVLVFGVGRLAYVLFGRELDLLGFVKLVFEQFVLLFLVLDFSQVLV